MQDTVMTIIAIVVAGILLFVFPLMAVSERSNDIAQTAAQKAVTEFIGEVSTTGAITNEQYSRLVSSLNATGNTYKIDMQITKVDENRGKKASWTNQNVVGENTSFNVYTETIQNSLDKKGSYNLKRGDTVSVTVSNSNRTLAQNFRSLLFAQDKDVAEISAHESAIVTATGSR